MLDAILDRAFLSDEPLPRDRAAFETLLERGKTGLAAARAEIGQIAAEILAVYHEVRRMLSGESSPVWPDALADIRDQLTHLVYPGFLRQHPNGVVAAFATLSARNSYTVEQASASPG